MKKMIKTALLVALVIFGMLSVYGVPEQNEEIAMFAKNTAQSKTFQIHTVKDIKYNFLNKKYTVKLYNNINKKYVKIKVWFPKDYQTTHLIACDYQ